MANKQAKKALEQFKMEAANEVGVNLQQGYNGDLTARQAGSIGGQMVKKMFPVRTMSFERPNRILKEHKTVHTYEFYLTLSRLKRLHVICGAFCFILSLRYILGGLKGRFSIDTMRVEKDYNMGVNFFGGISHGKQKCSCC